MANKVNASKDSRKKNNYCAGQWVKYQVKPERNLAYCKTRNAGTRNTDGTVKYPGTPAEHPRLPTEYQRNTSRTPPEQWSHTKRRTIVVFLRENLNLKI